MSEALHTVKHRSRRGAIVAMDCATDIREVNRARDVVVNASYCGVLAARIVAPFRPRAVIGVDCGVGLDGSGIAGLWYFEALNIPAAAVAVKDVILGDGNDVFAHGVISYRNRPAQDCGVEVGMTAASAARRLLDADPGSPSAYDVTNRVVVDHGRDGREVVVTDSIVFGRPEDQRNVMVTAGHAGRTGARHILAVRPFGIICSDGGRGRLDSGMAGLPMIEAEGIAGASIDSRQARFGDGMSTYRHGIINAVNGLAAAAGVRLGMTAADAARHLANR
jgi:hypothetical protein